MAKAAAKKSKGATRNAPAPKKPAPGWLWLLTGFVLAAFGFFLVHVWQGGGSKERLARLEAMLPPETAANTAPSGAGDSAADAASGNAAASSGSGDQHFDFYTLLPNQKVIPNRAAVEAGNREAAAVASGIHQQAATTTAPVTPTEAQQAPQTIEPRAPRASYFLQAGSFHNETQAESRRASIIMLGLPAKTERFDKDGASWYRVIVGPLASKEGLQSAQSSLKGSGIDSVMKKGG